MADVGNTAKIVLGNPDNGIIKAQGYNADFSGADFDKFLSLDKIKGRHEAVDKSALFYEKHSGAIILRPNLTLTSMDGTGYTTPTGQWKREPIQGQPQLTLEYQYNVAQLFWALFSAYDFLPNQGFLVYWQKWLTSAGLDPGFYFNLGDELMENVITVLLRPRERVFVTHTYENQRQDWNIEIPKTFYPTETVSDSLNVLACLIIEDYIILGIGGLENTIALKCQNYSTIADKNGKDYPLIMPANCALRISGAGAILLGYKKLNYASSGSLATPLGYLGYIMNAAPKLKFSKATVPTGTKITGKPWAGGNNIQGEDVGGSGRKGIEKSGAYAPIFFTGDTSGPPGSDGNPTSTVTPYLYSFRIHQPPVRVLQSGNAIDLDTDIRNYREESSGDKDGNFMGTSIYAQVVCQLSGSKISHSRLFKTKAPQVQHYLTLKGGSLTLRGLGILDVKEIGRPIWNKFDLDLMSQDITKLLRTTPILISENYDERGWTHVDLIKELASKAGVTIHCANISSDITVPADYHYLRPSGDTEKPNWQFNRGTMIWDAMQRAREFSGWLLCPNFDSGRDGELCYRPKPTSSSSAKYSFNADSASVTNVRYRSVDMYRTRIMIFGIAARDSSEVVKGDYKEDSWKHKKGDIIAGVGIHNELEEDLGRSIPLVWIDPTFSDWKSIGVALLRLYNYYTADHVTPAFQINNFEDYEDLHAYDLIAWEDDTKDYRGNKIIDDKFLVTSLSVNVKRFSAIANINTVAPEKGLVQGILQEDKKQREAGMRDYHDIVKGMEAVTNGDYQRMLTEAPGALRVFAYNDWRETANE